MKKIDEERLAINRPAYDKAVTAAALALRMDKTVDRALMAMPRLRDAIAEAAGLLGIGCSVREPATNAQLAELSRNSQFATAYRMAKEVAIAAATKALEGIDIEQPKTE